MNVCIDLAIVSLLSSSSPSYFSSSSPPPLLCISPLPPLSTLRPISRLPPPSSPPSNQTNEALEHERLQQVQSMLIKYCDLVETIIRPTQEVRDLRHCHGRP